MKKNFIEIFAIIIFATAISIAFNLFTHGKLYFIKKGADEVLVSDEDLFGEFNRLKNEVLSDTHSINGVDANNNIQSETDSKENQSNIARIDKNNERDQNIAKAETQLSNEQELNNKKDSRYKVVNYEQVLRIINNDEFIIIDARSPEMYSKDKIGNAINIFPYSDNESEVMDKIFTLPDDKAYLVYCDGGNCDSSHRIVDMLLSFGFERVFIFPGGWEEWLKKRQ